MSATVLEQTLGLKPNESNQWQIGAANGFVTQTQFWVLNRACPSLLRYKWGFKGAEHNLEHSWSEGLQHVCCLGVE